MNARVSVLAVCSIILFGSALAGCGSKSNSAPTTPAGTAVNSAPSAASFNDTSNPQAQRYQQAMKQGGANKSPYSR